MTLAFDSFSKLHRLTLSGKLTHGITLGDDVFGNITRIDNVLDGLEKSLQNCESKLANTEKQLKSVQEQVGVPFPQEAEYAEKSTRLRELNILLNLDERDNTVLDVEPDEHDAMPEPKVRECAMAR